ncbi:MAG: glycosyltransferase family 2 protein [Candidatus Dadabacteria bacterium]|nr:MAG: glycosyltransferase family 2 protein [Candidatus Dadabacteria bacterium]
MSLSTNFGEGFVARREQISAFIICCNEEADIRRALKSISWCDEIIVVDSGSTDRTLEIAREFTDKIYVREWPGFVKQKAYGLSVCTHPWVLNIDADEVVTEGLRDEILELLSREQSGETLADGYEIKRLIYYLGKWWTKGGWYPEYRLRLLRKEKASWGGRDPHEKAIVNGAVGRLNGHIEHYTYGSLSDHIHAVNSHSSAAAQALFNEGVKPSYLKIFFNPWYRFFKFYVIKQGYREGIRGLFVAIVEAFYVFLKNVKLWELWHRSGRV